MFCSSNISSFQPQRWSFSSGGEPDYGGTVLTTSVWMSGTRVSGQEALLVSHPAAAAALWPAGPPGPSDNAL